MAYRHGNYDFVIDSSFTPFTMQEMLVPFAAYKEAAERDEAAYIDLQDKADKFKYLSETLPEGSKARDIYESYANQLQADAQDFLRNGVSMENNRALLNLKRNYAGTIGRLEQVDAIRRAQIKEQNAIRQQDPTRMFSRRADMTPFDKYLENPDLSYESYSGALLTTQVANAVAPIAKGLNEYIKTGSLDKYTKTWIESHGFTTQQVANAIFNPGSADAPEVLKRIVGDVVNSSGILQWGDPSTIDDAYRYARMGLWNAIGQSQVHTYTDQGALLAEKARQEALAAGDQAGAGRYSMVPKYDRRNVRTTEEASEVMKEKELWDKYKQYFYKDERGTWHMNYEGRKKFNSKPSMNTYVPTQSGMMRIETDENREFKDFVNSHGLSEMANNRLGKGQNDNINKMVSRVNNVYDARQATEYIGLIDASQYDNVISSLNRASDDEGKVVKYKRRKTEKGYVFEPTGDKVDASSLTNADIKSAVPVYGVHGNYLEVSLKGGEKIYIPYSQLNGNYDSMIQGNINDAVELEKMKNEGYTDIDGIPIEILINQALNNAYENFMSGMGTTTIKNQEVTRDMYINK